MTTRHLMFCSLVLSFGLFLAPVANATLPAEIQVKVNDYKKKLSEWAADPAIVKATNEANIRGNAGMSNAKWDELADSDPAIQATVTNPVSQKLRKWEEDKAINKLFLRDKNGNVIAGVTRTTLFYAAKRPHISAALKGEKSHIDEIKPDPSTQIKSVQLAVPVFDGEKVIGVLHTAITAE